MARLWKCQIEIKALRNMWQPVTAPSSPVSCRLHTQSYSVPRFGLKCMECRTEQENSSDLKSPAAPKKMMAWPLLCSVSLELKPSSILTEWFFTLSSSQCSTLDLFQ